MQLDSDMKIKHLTDTMKAFSELSFEWGISDCCQFVGEYIYRCTGNDLRLPYGKYSTAIGAKRAQNKVGTFEETISKHFKEVKVNMAQRGDIAIVVTPEGGALAIVSTQECWTMCFDGLYPVKGKILKAWRI